MRISFTGSPVHRSPVSAISLAPAADRLPGAPPSPERARPRSAAGPSAAVSARRRRRAARRGRGSLPLAAAEGPWRDGPARTPLTLAVARARARHGRRGSYEPPFRSTPPRGPGSRRGALRSIAPAHDGAILRRAVPGFRRSCISVEAPAALIAAGASSRCRRIGPQLPRWSAVRARVGAAHARHGAHGTGWRLGDGPRFARVAAAEATRGSVGAQRPVPRRRASGRVTSRSSPADAPGMPDRCRSPSRDRLRAVVAAANRGAIGRRVVDGRAGRTSAGGEASLAVASSGGSRRAARAAGVAASPVSSPRQADGRPAVRIGTPERLTAKCTSGPRWLTTKEPCSRGSTRTAG